MKEKNISIEGIIQMLALVPKKPEYSTRNIEIARGKYKYIPSAIQRIKNLFK